LLESSSTFKLFNEPDCSSKTAKLFPSFTQELQAEFNQEFLSDLHDLQLDDWNRYGKARQRWEKHLRDPDDVFIHAEERKKQLAKQRKRTTKKKPCRNRKALTISR